MTKLLGFVISGGLLLAAANPSFAAQLSLRGVNPANGGAALYCLDARGIINLSVSTSVGGSGTTADQRVALRLCDESDAQQFDMNHGMIHTKTGKCLELGQGEVVGSAKVRLLMTNTCTGGQHQQWRIGRHIENASAAQQCLSSLGEVKAGARLAMMAECSASNSAQDFRLY